MNKLAITSLCAAVLLLAGCEDKNKDGNYTGTNYKVESFDGVPFITADGNPVRGRMFYGSFPGDKRKVVGDKPTDVSIEFVSNIDSDNGAMRMCFETKIKDIFVSGATLTNLEDKSVQNICDLSSKNLPKNFSANKRKYSAQNKNGVLHISKSTNPADGTINFYLGGFKLKKNVKYKLTVTAKFNEAGWFDMVVYTPDNILGQSAEATFVIQQKMAADAGVNFVTLGIPIFWDAKLAANYERIYDKIFQSLIATNPNVRVIARVGVDARANWLDKNPDSEMRNFDGKATTRMSRGANPTLQRFAAVSSEKYRADASQALRQSIEMLERKYGKYIAGYHPCGANTGEWFYAQSPTSILSGYDKSTLKAWRKWLGKKYSDAAALQKAWNNPAVDFENAAVPTNEERSSLGFIIDPSKQQNVVDFHLFLQEEMADTILTFAKVIRETTKKNPKLSMTFYGYGFEFSAVHHAPAVVGHFALRKILDSPDIDILSGPVSYNDRGKGGSKSTMGASESCAFSQKIWCDEDDNRTYLMWSSGSIILVGDPNQRTQKDSIDVMRRNLAQQTIRNNASWWMDLFGTGWYIDPVLWKQIELFKNAELDMIKNPRQYNPPVALIYDETSMCHVGRNSAALTGTLMARSRHVMNRAGVPFGQYLLDDILENRATPKLNAFLCAFALDEKQRKQMRALADKSACIWTWGTGYVDTGKRNLSMDNVAKTTGFEVKDAGDVFPMAYPTEEGKKAGLIPFGHTVRKLTPAFSPIPQKGDVVLANYSNGLPALVMRTSGKHPQFFCGVSVIPIELYRYACKAAGIHVYTEQPAAVFANGAYVSVCATTSETHTVDFATDKNIYDALTNELVGKGPILKFDLKKGEVRFLRIGDGNKSLK